MYSKNQLSLKQSEWESILTSAEILKDRKLLVIKLIIYIQ